MSLRLRQWLGFLIMLAGLIVLSSPFLVGAYQGNTQKNVVEEFHRREFATQPTTAAAVPTEAARVEITPQTEPETMATTVPAQTEPETTAATVPSETEPEITAATEPETTAATVPQETEPETTAATQPETEPKTTTEAATVPTETTAPATAPMVEETKPVPIAGTLGAEKAEETVPSDDPIQQFYQAAVEYNTALAENGQDDMHSLYDLEYHALDSRDYGFQEDIVGTIRIPRLNVELALYLGANGDNMAKGAAIFGMTSIPLGKPSENAAIAGHRGWRGTPVFRDIQMIQMDDPIYVTTPWAELEYRVCDIEIVHPNNLTWCKIQQGRSLITLMTCHPYGKNYQRYIVYAELVPGNSAEERITLQKLLQDNPAMRRHVKLYRADGTQEKVIVELPQMEATEMQPVIAATQPEEQKTEVTVIHVDGTRETANLSAETAEKLAQEPEQETLVLIYPDGTSDTAVVEEETVPTVETSQETPILTAVTIVGEDGTREEAMVDSTAIDPDGREYGAVLSNVVIMAENKMRPIACVMAVFVGAVGLWLTIQTIRDLAQRKRRKEK